MAAMPICRADGVVVGMLTDRDIVVKSVAESLDARVVRVAVFAQAHVLGLVPHDSVEAVVTAFADSTVDHLPVLAARRLLGVLERIAISAWFEDERRVGHLRPVAGPAR